MTLKSYCDAVLANVNAIWAAQAPPIALPALQYVAPGPFSSVSFDCDQVTVTVDAVTRGAPGEPQAGYVKLAECSATISVAIIRLCMPTSGTEAPPPAAAQAAASDTTLADLDVLWRRAKAILDADGCRHHGLVTAQLVEIQGGAGGARLTGSIDLLEA